jgi:MFS family permease
VALLVMGFISTWAGRLIDRIGARAVMCAGTIIVSAHGPERQIAGRIPHLRQRDKPLSLMASQYRQLWVWPAPSQ